MRNSKEDIAKQRLTKQTKQNGNTTRANKNITTNDTADAKIRGETSRRGGGRKCEITGCRKTYEAENSIAPHIYKQHESQLPKYPEQTQTCPYCRENANLTGLLAQLQIHPRKNSNPCKTQGRKEIAEIWEQITKGHKQKTDTWTNTQRPKNKI